MTKLTAILATGRISNLPTVWCNVFVASLLISLTENNLYITLILTALSASLLYVGGCFLGDALDADFDRIHKPTRPIPSGILRRKTILTSAVILILTGIAITLSTQPILTITHIATTLALAGSITAYSLWHKKSPWLGLPLIGACRFFLILFAASAINPSLTSITGTFPPSILIFATTVGIFTISFASVARTESSPSPVSWRKALIVIMLLLPLASYLITPAPYHPAGIIIYWLWMISAFRQISSNKGKFVSMSLAAFCLLDGSFITPIGLSFYCITFALFALSTTLQKWAPAT